MNEPRPCAQLTTLAKPNGNLITVKTYSYVALLTEKGGSEVKAVRLDGYPSKNDRNLWEDIKGNYPGWKIKGIWKLYDEDFD